MPCPSNRSACSRLNGTNSSRTWASVKPTPLSRTWKTALPSLARVAPTSTRGRSAPPLNLMALASRLANTWRTSAGSACRSGSSPAMATTCGAAAVAPVRRSATSRTSASVCTGRRSTAPSAERASSSSEVTRSVELSDWRAMAASSRSAAVRSPRPSASRAMRDTPVMPPSGPRRSCDTLRLKLSRPSMVSRSCAVRSATRSSSVWLVRSSSAWISWRAASSRALLACARTRPVVRMVMPSTACGTISEMPAPARLSQPASAASIEAG